MEEINLQKTRELYSYFGAGNIPALLAALDPDIVWVNPGPSDFAYFGSHRGPEAVARKTGRRIVQDIAHAFTFREGRPVHFHDYQDTAQIAAALR